MAQAWLSRSILRHRGCFRGEHTAQSEPKAGSHTFTGGPGKRLSLFPQSPTGDCTARGKSLTITGACVEENGVERNKN